MKLLVAFLAAVLLASPAQAYIGPGAGLGAVGSAVALLLAVVLLLVGFVWYPMKRLVRRLRGRTRPGHQGTGEG